MNMPSLLDDYNCYREMSKRPIRNYIDLREIHFITPTSALPIKLFMDNYGFEINEKLCNENSRDHILKVFGKHKSNENMEPIKTFFLKNKIQEEKDNIIRSLGKNIRSFLKDKGADLVDYGGYDIFPYIISELLNNVSQHSQADRLYSCIQFYPYKGIIDVSFLDDGVSIPGGYENNSFEFENEKINPFSFKDDCEAICNSLKGISTKRGFIEEFKSGRKDLWEYDTVGHGLNTSFRMITEGLKSNMLIVSRTGICYLKNKKAKLIKQEKDNIINGTLVSVRFKKGEINRDEFLEYKEINLL